MKRLQIYLDEDLGVALDLRARREHRSKAAIIRDAVRRELLPDDATSGGDAFDAWIGGSAGEIGDIDDVVYGR